MDVILTADTVITAGPALVFRGVASLPRGAIVKTIDRQNGYLRLQPGSAGEQLWVDERLTQPTLTGGVGPALQLSAKTAAHAPGPEPLTEDVTWSWGPRLVGALQLVGGVLEVGLGIGGVAVPSGVTQVGGVILIAHGSDTIIAGFRTLWDGEVKQSFTQTGATMAAQGLGASQETAQRIGMGVDFAAGVGPSIGVSVTRRLAIAGAERATTKVAVAYLSRGALQMGHNAVGVRTGGTTAWVHFAGLPRGAVVPRGTPGAEYVITELAVTGQQAARAIQMQNTLLRSGIQTWRVCGPNCTTTALQVLRSGGVVVPGWSLSPGLLHLGVRSGGEITFMAGAIGTMAPDIAAGSR
jgi:hypothetical protein